MSVPLLSGSNATVSLQMRESTTTPHELLRGVAKDFRRRPVRYAAIFTAIALLGLVVGVMLPKKYASRTTIVVEDSNIIRPLMEGRAVPTAVADRAALAKEVAFSNKVMHEILRVGGWMDAPLSPIEQDRLIEQVKNRTQIDTGEKLIQIEYSDSDPQRAYAVTKALGDQVISESLAAKARESREAFQFIDAQVNTYHDKLKQSEARLEAYRSVNPDARPGVETEVNGRIADLRHQVDTADMDLQNARSKETAIKTELGNESEVNAVQTREGQIRAQMADLMNQRAKLLLTYTDQYPDVVRINHQLDDLQAQLKNAEATRKVASTAQGGSSLESTSTINPLYGELRSKLAAARSESASINARRGTAEQLLGGAMAQNRGIAAAASALAELTRDYEVNRDLYQDLLKRRENARLSMNLDEGHRGMSFRVQEPALVPVRASGLRLMHVAIASLVVALLLPLALLLATVKFDHKLRSPEQVETLSAVPLLGVTPRYATRAGRASMLRQAAFAASLFLAVPVVYGALAIFRAGGL
ncbi:XrtA system polysaccharide chain length determinant [Solilutibacter silvestris]|uniref:PEP-CTERM polysaccharide chain length determinant protein n=1 Tax=Solilutibacter silvestris TaxID=1645665 RepID=A0A2K1PZC7_9GAMM|nr:XrtA system polysaccharide chain length determinant [Lysobacter silvestris]PNS08152.1 PEP-CTERM polysaccharide chain length determinant protein [Lysobacter silvestris]